MPSINAGSLRWIGRTGRTHSSPRLCPTLTLETPFPFRPRPTIHPLCPSHVASFSSTRSCLQTHFNGPNPALDTPLLHSWFTAVTQNDLTSLYQLYPVLKREAQAISSARSPSEAQSTNKDGVTSRRPPPRSHERYTLASREGIDLILAHIDNFKGSIAWDSLLSLQLSRLVETEVDLPVTVLERIFHALIRGAYEPGSESLELVQSASLLLTGHGELASNLVLWQNLAEAFIVRGEFYQAQSALSQAEAQISQLDPEGQLQAQASDALPLTTLRDTVSYQLGAEANHLATLLENLDLSVVPTFSIARALGYMILPVVRSWLADQLVTELVKRSNMTEPIGIEAQIVYRAARLTGDPVSRMGALRSLLSNDNDCIVSDNLFTKFFHLAMWDSLNQQRDYERVIFLVRVAEKMLHRPAPHRVWELCVEGLLGQAVYPMWRSPEPEPHEPTAVLNGVAELSPLRLVEAGLLLEHCTSTYDPALPAGGWVLLLRAYSRSFVPNFEAIAHLWEKMQVSYQGSLGRQGGGGAYEELLVLAREKEDMQAIMRVLHIADERADMVSVTQMGQPQFYVDLAENEEDLMEFHRTLMRLLARSLIGPELVKWHEAYLTAIVDRRFALPGRRGRLLSSGVPVSGNALLEVCRGLRHIGRAPDGVQYVKLLNKVKTVTARDTDSRRRDGSRDDSAAQIVRAEAGELVTALHTALQEDGTVEADVRLLNTLMNAYNFAGDAEAALGIWFSLLRERHAITPNALSILFDLCGWARLPQPAAQAWVWARAQDQKQIKAMKRPARLASPRRAPAPPFESTPISDPSQHLLRPGQAGAPEDNADSRAWMSADRGRLINDHVRLSYIEMLCRCYLLKPASELAWALVETGEMEGKRGVEREMWTLLLKFFARKRDRLQDPLPQRQLFDALRTRIRRERPHIWDQDLACVGNERRTAQQRNANTANGNGPA